MQIKRLSSVAFSILTIFAISTLANTASSKDFTCPPKPANAKKTRRLAGVYFKKAEELFVAEKYNAAIDRFLCSMTMVEHKNTVFNLAQSAKAASNKQRAHDALVAYLEANPGSTTAAELQELIDQLANELVPVEPEQEKDPAPEPIPEPSLESEPLKESKNLARPLRIAGFLTAGAGVAGLATGGVFLGLAASSRNKAETAENYDDYQSANDDWDTRSRVGTIGIIAGGALVATGGVLLVASLLADKAKTDTDDEALEVVVIPTGRGLVLTGRF